jgi:nicotinamidase/pyrazinamidase
VKDTALIVVDLQLDFMPGGALAVKGGDEIVGPINALMLKWIHLDLGPIVATQDWHPSGHISFASSHPCRVPFDEIELYGKKQTLWPDHCIRGSKGAEFHEHFMHPLVNYVIRKGSRQEVDSYSAFEENWNSSGIRPPTGLAGLLRDLLVEKVAVVGLAGDLELCVGQSALSASRKWFETHYFYDLTRHVFPEKESETYDALSDADVEVETSEEFMSKHENSR